MNLVVNISDARASANPEVVLVTYSLGSCIGITLYDPIKKIGGMLHYQLPTSTMDPQRGQREPCMFADTGFDYLIKQMTDLGADPKRLRVRLAGGAQIMDAAGVFNIGKRNHAAVRKILWQRGMLIDSEDIGGMFPRTLYLRVATGDLEIKTTAGGAIEPAGGRSAAGSV